MSVGSLVLIGTLACACAVAAGCRDAAAPGTSGSLTLDPVTAQFTITLNATSACSGPESPLFTETGSYTQDGDALTLTDPYPGQADNLSGHIDARAIAIEGARYDFSFAR